MSYFSDIEYKMKEGSDALWFERLYFDRWFGTVAGRILDVGCATGNFIALDPTRIEGIDIDEDSLTIAKNRGFNVRKLNAETGMESLQTTSYEGIYAKHVLEHLTDPLEFLKQLHRILVPGGKIVLSTPNCPYMLKRAFWDDYTHVHPFTKVSLRMIAYDAGFKEVKIYQDFRCFPGLGKFMRIFHLSPAAIRRAQSVLGIQGLSLIMELTK